MFGKIMKKWSQNNISSLREGQKLMQAIQDVDRNLYEKLLNTEYDCYDVDKRIPETLKAIKTFSKPFLIIVEGPQGSGKSTVTNLLREKIKSVNLIRMSGVEDKTTTGKEKSLKVHLETLKMIKKTNKCNINYVLDRSFVSELVFAHLGTKKYEIYAEDVMEIGKEIEKLKKKYNLLYIILSAPKDVIDERLKRDKAVYESFSAKNSERQLEEYREVSEVYFSNYIEYENADSEAAVEEIKKRLLIK